MAITVNDIRNKQFKMEGRGYNCDEVDDFLDALAEQTEKLIRENTGLKNELAAAKEQAEAAKAAEKTALEAVHTPAVQQDAPPNCAVVPAFTQREPSPKAEDGPVCAPRIS